MRLHDYLYSNLIYRLSMENDQSTFTQQCPFNGKGRVIYSPSVRGICDPSWVIVECEDDIAKYYRWFLKKRGIQLEALMWGSHISIVRGMHDVVDKSKKHLWGYKNNEIISYSYGDLVTNGTHWWIEVQSKELEELRIKLGLDSQPDFKFHLSVGRIRDKFVNKGKR